MKKKYRRRQLLIIKRFQIRYISLILLFMFATALLTGYTVYVTTWIMFGEKLAAVYPQGLLFDIAKKVNMVLFLRLIFLSPMVILIGLVLSNRIAGPIYRIRLFLKDLTEGNYEGRIRLRKKDELKDVAEDLNILVSSLDSDQKDRKALIDKIKKDTDDLEAAVIAGAPDKEKLLRKVLEIKGQIDSFKV